MRIVTGGGPRKLIMTDPRYKAFAALDPFFDIVQQGLAGHVDGDHYRYY